MKDKPAPKVSTEQLCRDYYNHELFRVHDPHSDFELTVLFEIQKVDPSAMAIDLDIFVRELTALNIELFGFAWCDHNYPSEEQRQGQADSALCTEITFTESYLAQMKESEIWKAAGFYNNTIAEATLAQKTSRDWSTPRDIPAYYERGANPFTEKEAKLLMNSIREHFAKLLSDKECSLRLSNRLISVESWRDGIIISQKLSSAFTQRLNFSPNSEAFFLIQRLTVGLYKNAKDYINAVEDYGSWELARKASDELRQHLIRVAQKEVEKQNGSDEPKQL